MFREKFDQIRPIISVLVSHNTKPNTPENMKDIQSSTHKFDLITSIFESYYKNDPLSVFTKPIPKDKVPKNETILRSNLAHSVKKQIPLIYLRSSQDTVQMDPNRN